MLPELAQEVPKPLGTMDQIGLASSSELTPETDGYDSLLRKLEKAYMDDPWLAVRANRRKVSLKGGFGKGMDGSMFLPCLRKGKMGNLLLRICDVEFWKLCMTRLMLATLE